MRIGQKAVRGGVRVAAAALALVCAPATPADASLDIVQIYGQFVQARHAVSRCAPPDADTLAGFARNFAIVEYRATEAMRERNPGATDARIAAHFRGRGAEVRKLIDTVIDEQGCDDPRIDDLLRRFEVQATLKF